MPRRRIRWGRVFLALLFLTGTVFAIRALFSDRRIAIALAASYRAAQS